MKNKNFHNTKIFCQYSFKNFSKIPPPYPYIFNAFFFYNKYKIKFQKNQHHMKIKTNIQNIIKKLKNIKINVKKTIKK